MKYTSEIVVGKTLGDEMEKIVQESIIAVKKDGIEFDEEVLFSNGNRMAIQVCGPSDPGSEPCWTQGVLFSPEGNELGCTDVGEAFEGEYYVYANDDEYIVEVIITPTG